MPLPLSIRLRYSYDYYYYYYTTIYGGDRHALKESDSTNNGEGVFGLMMGVFTRRRSLASGSASVGLLPQLLLLRWCVPCRVGAAAGPAAAGRCVCGGGEGVAAAALLCALTAMRSWCA